MCRCFPQLLLRVAVRNGLFFNVKNKNESGTAQGRGRTYVISHVFPILVVTICGIALPRFHHLHSQLIFPIRKQANGVPDIMYISSI